MKNFIVAVLCLFLAGCSNQELPQENLFVSKLDANYYIQTNRPITVNIIMLEEINSSISLKNDLKTVDINNKNILVNDFNINVGDKVKNKYNLINLELDILCKDEGSFSFEEITLTLNNNNQYKENIGNVLVVSSQKNIRNNNDLSPPTRYTVSYPKLEFTTELKNNTDKEIHINNIKINNQGLEFSNFKLTKNNQLVNVIKPKETVLLEAQVAEKNKYHFFVSTPVITYSSNDLTKEIYLPSVMYGYMSINENVIDDILNQ